MNDREHGQLFRNFTEWKIRAFQILKELNKNNIKETKDKLLIFNKFYTDNRKKYSFDHTLSGELIDLGMVISKIEAKIKELEK